MDTHKVAGHEFTADAVDTGALVKENASLREENASLRERMLRALAESENILKRADRAGEEARNFAISQFAREILTVVDNLERTIDVAHNQTIASVDILTEGVEATLRILKQILQRYGIERIETLGRRFDPNFHEAVTTIDDPSVPPGTIVRVIDQGYTLHNRLLRPSRVIVAQRQRKPTPERDDGDLGFEWGLNS